MAEVLLSVVAEGILNKVFSLVAEEVSLISCFKEELQLLGRKLEMIQALLIDAGSKELRMNSVKLWLKKLKAIASDADDLLDGIAYEVLRRKVEVRDKLIRKVRDFFSSSNKLAFHVTMSHKVKNVNRQFDEIYQEATEIGLRAVELINNTTEFRELRQSHPFVNDAEVIGRDGDMSTIVDDLISPNSVRDLSVTAIVGMGGQGKTTLAQIVYQNDKVVRHFDCKMWICVSNDFDIKRILNDMLQSLNKVDSNMSNMEALIKRLQESASGKRFLLVLDDVWNENELKWDFMKSSLSGIGGSRGSKILVTTRSDTVALSMQASFTHHLGGLSMDDSWTIFKRRAFAEGGAKETPNLLDVGKMILKRCGGVPLASKALGGLMYSKKYEYEWLTIQNSEIWDSTEDKTGVMATLKLSYDNLPSTSLKQCFSYCSIFLKDVVIEKDTLIQLWMAQGFLDPSQGSDVMMEDIGNCYFNMLIWNSLLQDVIKDDYDNITTCKMHDLVHDLALHTSKNNCLTWDDNEVNDMSDIQHLSWNSSKENNPTVPKRRAKRLHTLFVTCDLVGHSLLNFKCLRALSLTSLRIEELPKSIGKLKHLRYLDISRTNIRKLPNSFTRLYNLQTLKLFDCHHLKELPNNFENLVSLRHFYINHEEEGIDCLMVGIRQLICLQTIPSFIVSQDKGCQLLELERLSNLRGELKIFGLEDVRNMEEAKRADLSKKTRVHSLELHWGDQQREDCNDEEVLEGLEPHSNLKGLSIENFGGKIFASWMTLIAFTRMPLNNLVKIRLMNCRKCEVIPALGLFPYLKFVEICGMDSVKSIGSEFYGLSNYEGGSSNKEGNGRARTVFPALKELIVRDMGSLVKWFEVASPLSDCVVFPCLEKLLIEDCPQLIYAPSHFPSMKDLTIEGLSSCRGIAQMSRKLTSLSSLHIAMVPGSEVEFVLENLFENNQSLHDVTIFTCDGLTYFPNSLNNLVSLRILRVYGCNGLTSMGDMVTSSNNFRFLEEIYIVGCEKLIYLPTGLQNIVSLMILVVNDCPNLVEIPDMRCLTSLRVLGISNCEKLANFTSGLEVYKSLEILRINSCPALNYCPSKSELVSCPRLRSLTLADCGIFTTSWPEELHLLTSLRHLGIGGFCGGDEELDYFPWPSDNQTLQLIFSLEILELFGWSQLKSLPLQIQHLTALNQLELRHFNELEVLPDWLGNLSSL